MLFSVRRWRSLAIAVIIIVLTFYYFKRSTDRLILDGPLGPYRPLPLTSIRHWSKIPEKHPVTSIIPLPTGEPTSIPKIQASPSFEDAAAKKERLRRRAMVKGSFVHCWNGYKNEAWMMDEVMPISGGGKVTFGGWAATLVDSLDTLWIMGMKEDFGRAVKASGKIDFTTTKDEYINVFETTIRYLGGFLAAYDLSGAKYPLLLKKATEIGDLLMSCFDTPNRMPITMWDWKSYMDGEQQVAPNSVGIAEFGSLSIEFTRLSQLTGDAKYYDAVQRISNLLEETQNSTVLPGMWPVIVNARTLDFKIDNWFQLGGMADSLYEYLPKQYLMLGGLLEQPKNLYINFIGVAKKLLFFRPLNPDNLDILISGDLRINTGGPQFTHTGQHLGCFVGGMVGIASRIFGRSDDLQIAKKLANGCVWAYDSQVTGIAPEIFSVVGCQSDDSCTWSKEKWYQHIRDRSGFNSRGGETYEHVVESIIAERRIAPGFTDVQDRRYLLRPEAIESVFIMYRLTGDQEWQDKAWRMFEAIEKVTKTSIAASAIADVTSNSISKKDNMESFWLAETLKYFYLIFSDMDLVSLDDYVFNTEAHPLKRPGR